MTAGVYIYVIRDTRSLVLIDFPIPYVTGSYLSFLDHIWVEVFFPY